MEVMRGLDKIGRGWSYLSLNRLYLVVEKITDYGVRRGGREPQRKQLL